MPSTSLGCMQPRAARVQYAMASALSRNLRKCENPWMCIAKTSDRGAFLPGCFPCNRLPRVHLTCKVSRHSVESDPRVKPLCIHLQLQTAAQVFADESVWRFRLPEGSQAIRTAAPKQVLEFMGPAALHHRRKLETFPKNGCMLMCQFLISSVC
jgi:hypothetical protein